MLEKILDTLLRRDHIHYMGDPESARKLIRDLIFFLLLLITLQFFFPNGYGLPNTSRPRIVTTFKNIKAITEDVEALNNQPVIFVAEGNQYEVLPKDIGLTINGHEYALHAATYPWYWRLVPGSLFFLKALPHEQKRFVDANETKIREFSKKVIDENIREAINANLRIDQSQVVVEESKAGYRYREEDLVQQIANFDIMLSDTLNLRPESLLPGRKASDLSGLIATVEQNLNQKIQIKALDKIEIIPREIIGGFIGFSEDSESKDLKVVYKKEAIEDYLRAFAAGDITIPPEPMIVTTYDDTETGRSPGKTGRDVQYASATNMIAEALSNRRDEIIELPIEVLSPGIEYSRSYSPNRALQNFLSQTAAKRSGRWTITVIEAGGQNRQATFNGTKFVTASTYKLFTNYLALEKIDKGELSESTVTPNGKTIGQCLEESIVHSLDNCSVAIAQLIGWPTIDALLKDRGFSNTTLNNYNPDGSYNGDKYSTSYDEAIFLLRLHNGSLLSQANTNRLLDLMKRQVYRTGIPAGVPGITVANKVGFLEGYLNDAAIVYHPNRTYILVIMTYGSSWWQIAQATREINNYLNR